MPSRSEIEALVPLLQDLSSDQWEWLKAVISALAQPITAWRAKNSVIVPNNRVLAGFGDFLKTHHVSTAEPFKKEKFEYAVELLLREDNQKIERPASRTNRGQDLTVNGVRWSLKTQANQGIKEDVIWISKWMEMGKGQWTDQDDDLKTLCRIFLEHLKSYDRIFVLRCLTPTNRHHHKYELVEIPKGLLEQAPRGQFKMMHESRQSPKPGYCTLRDANGVMCQLYFDGGSERKLQLKDLRKDLCALHATWEFRTLPTLPSQ